MIIDTRTKTGRNTAIFSTCEGYRYVLERELDADPNWPTTGRILFIMLNPSTADQDVLDPTLRRCEGYAKAWCYKTMVVCNIFAWRDTDPKLMKAERYPVGPYNDHYISMEAGKADMIILGWGSHGAHLNRSGQVLELLKPYPGKVHYLALTKGGQPRHPLYLKSDLLPQLWKYEK